MRYLLAAVAVLAALAAGAHYTVTLDAELPALMITSPAQVAECRAGGGCMPWSQREIIGMSRHAHDIGVQSGARWAAGQCGQRGS